MLGLLTRFAFSRAELNFWSGGYSLADPFAAYRSVELANETQQARSRPG